ncbi:MAG TPA: sigma-70 family RNA polymerase sigma factor [Caulobacterales bacterium]|nr:sigma-70 family RNA polymerase sigma factor [Caulobacterales bacterium]
MADTEKDSALTSTYLSKRESLVRFFTLRTASAAEAEDIVQEIYVKIANLDGSAIENASAFLYKLGSNILLDRLRAKRRAEARDSAYFDSQAGESGGLEPSTPAPSPEQAWAARRRLADVLRVIDAFPPQRRRVFTMHKIEGLSYGEVAETLGISKSAVEKHMIAALRQLASLADP